jgi:malate dehydrogenase (oxaloacetate-decarboxylating)(NADP+)
MGRRCGDRILRVVCREGALYPPQSNILDTELRTATRIAEVVFERGLARVTRPADIDEFIRQHTYTPTYTNLV